MPFIFWNISSAEHSNLAAISLMSSLKTVFTSSSVMPQMAEKSGRIDTFFRLLMVEKMLSCENLVMPVMKQNLR